MKFTRYFILVILFLSGNIQSFAQNCNLIPPSNLSISNLSSCNATLQWTSGTSVQKFTVSYRIKGTGQWSPNVNVGTNTSYQFTGLLASTKYDFSVVSKCNDGTKSERVKITGKTLACTLPDDVKVTAINSTSAKIEVVTSCSFDTLSISYQPVGGVAKTKSYPVAASYTLDGLSTDSVYLIQVSTCPKPITSWTPTDTLHLPALPNIILIILDDGRYDYFSCNGAPSFVHTPNIDRIANEGVNFQRSYVVSSLCAPSRATIATGLFTLKTNVKDNLHPLNPSFVTIPEVLGENGYYTALVGKNHFTFFQGSVPEFDYYLATDIKKEDGIHYDYNGVKIIINKEDELTHTDTAIALINRVNDPLFLWLAYRVPHLPIDPLPSFKGDYDGFPIPWKADTAKYTVNYPSFIYIGQKIHGYTLDTTYRATLEEIAGLDSCIGELFKALETTNKLDNTLLIFMSDNGYLMGSHWLNGKVKSYEPSIRIPLFLRYPAWFEPQSIIKDQFALNMDIAPTIYDAAGIDFTGPMDGRSLRSLYDGTFSRQEYYYLMPHNSGDNNTPAIRCIRDQHYKYVHYTCFTDTVEEFFDMVNDSLELTNQINNSAYQSLIAQYRIKYDSIRIAWQDIAVGPKKECYIENPFVLKEMYEETESTPDTPSIYPNLTSGSVEIFIPWPDANAGLYDEQGAVLRSWKITDSYSKTDLQNLPDGIYLLHFMHQGASFTEKLVLKK